MNRNRLLIAMLLALSGAKAQYHFSGQLSDEFPGKAVYLSLIEDYRRVNRISFDQIIRKTTTDSLGRFHFEGENLSEINQLYRIHVDDCSAREESSGHFLGNCSSNRSVIFAANNRDTLALPSTFGDEIFCTVESTNPASGKILEIAALKEQMILDFTEIRTEASKKLNLKTWFSKWQEYAVSLREPLLELVIYEFLSDRANETYAYYLQDLGTNPYYEQLLERLQDTYPEEGFTAQFANEIQTDLLLTQADRDSIPWNGILGALLLISLSFNTLLLIRQRRLSDNTSQKPAPDLTPQEQKIALLIQQNRTNKEIASELFISISTVKTHVNNLYKKLGVTDREKIKIT